MFGNEEIGYCMYFLILFFIWYWFYLVLYEVCGWKFFGRIVFFFWWLEFFG